MNEIECARRRNRKALAGFRFTDCTELVQDEHWLLVPAVESTREIVEEWPAAVRPHGVLWRKRRAWVHRP